MIRELVKKWWHRQTCGWPTHTLIETSHGIINNNRAVAKEYVHPVRDMLTEANLVTASGLGTLLYATYLVFVGSENNFWLVPWLFVWGAGLSDALDGLAAQWSGRYSRFGRMLDPVRDRYTIVLICLMLVVNEPLNVSWMLPLFAVLVMEVWIAYLNRQLDGGSHAWSKRRYLVHLVVMCQYICQSYWLLWPDIMSVGFMTMTMAFASLVALLSLRTRAAKAGLFAL